MAWVIYLDVFYATQDHQDDGRFGVKSLAALLGDQTGIVVAFLVFSKSCFVTVTALEASMSYL